MEKKCWLPYAIKLAPAHHSTDLFARENFRMVTNKSALCVLTHYFRRRRKEKGYREIWMSAVSRVREREKKKKKHLAGTYLQ
jgi:hypothetical protein